MVVNFYDQLFNQGDLAVIDTFVRPDYIQHNPSASSGSQTLRDLVASLKAALPDSRVVIKRALAEGDLVMVHSNFLPDQGSRGSAAFDIFRIEDGKIAEHWDVVQSVPDNTASGNDMFSTISTPPVAGPDLDVSTVASKEAAQALFTATMVDRDLTAFDRYLADPFYQHSPKIPNGTASVKEAFNSTFAQNPDFSVSTKRVIAEGDYVAFHSHYKTAADHLGFAVVDLYRVRDGKIVEHWDATQPVPATSANNNTMF